MLYVTQQSHISPERLPRELDVRGIRQWLYLSEDSAWRVRAELTMSPDTRRIPIADLLDEMSWKLRQYLPPRGALLYRVPRFPLAPGTYSVKLGANANDLKVDRVMDAAVLDVVPGDFFGTGRSVRELGDFLCDHSWVLAETEVPADAERHEVVEYEGGGDDPPVREKDDQLSPNKHQSPGPVAVSGTRPGCSER